MTLPVRLPAPARSPEPLRGPLVVVGVLPVLVVEPRLLPVVAAAATVWSVRGRLRRRRAQRAAATAVFDDLPMAVALLQIAAAAGHGPRPAIGLVGTFGWGRVAATLREASARLAQGVAFADALTAVEPVRLVELLERADDDGGAWAASLAAFADDLHRDRLAAAEERTGRLTVALLVPLVVCILPALVLLAIVPVVAGALLDVTG